MATENKYFLSKSGLEHYNIKIHADIDAGDEEALNAAKQYAKEYADGLAENYDAAGTAATKVNELANGQVKTNKEAIDAINNETTGILAQAKTYADQAADAKDDDIAAAKKAGDDAQANLTTHINGDFASVKGRVDALEAGTYDDTEVRGLIKANADAIDAVEGRADALENQMETLVGDDAGKSARTIANEELAKQLIAENAAESLNELQEIAAWIQSHPGDAAAMNRAIEDLEALVGTLPSGITATTIVGYIQEVVNDEKVRAEAAEGALGDRIGAIEGNIGTGTVDGRIEAAKTAAIEAAAGDATTKANAARDEAKSYTDAEIGKIDLSGIQTNANDISGLKGRMDGAESNIGDIQTSLATGGATANAIADAKKAGTDAQASVTALAEGQVQTNANDIAALKSVNYIEITTAEIDAMFA